MKQGIISILLVVCLLTGCEKTNYIEEGTTQLEAQQYEEAVASFEKSLEEKEDIAEAYRGLGMAYFEQQDYEKSRDAFQKVLDNEGEATPTLYNFMGICSMQLNDEAKALEAFQKGIDLAESTEGKKETTDYTEAVQEMKFNQIVCYENQADWENAKAKAEEYIAEYPDDKAAQKEAEFLRTR